MKLYRYEFGSDDGDEEILAGKKLVGEFTDRDAIIDYISNYYALIAVSIESDKPIGNFDVLVAVPVHHADELPDEVLWLFD